MENIDKYTKFIYTLQYNYMMDVGETIKKPSIQVCYCPCGLLGNKIKETFFNDVNDIRCDDSVFNSYDEIFFVHVRDRAKQGCEWHMAVLQFISYMSYSCRTTINSQLSIPVLLSKVQCLYDKFEPFDFRKFAANMFPGCIDK